MAERRYSVNEINRMRQAIEWFGYGSEPYYPSDRNTNIENRLRTYMLNGTDPDDLVRSLSNHLDFLDAKARARKKNPHHIPHEPS